MRSGSAGGLQKLIEVCGACDALCECRAARIEETDALRRLPQRRDPFDISALQAGLTLQYQEKRYRT